MSSPPPRATERSTPQAIGEIIRENVFTPYRQRLLYPSAAIAGLVLLPLALSHFHDGDHATGALTLALVAMIAVDAVATSRGKRPPIPFWLLLVPAASALAVAMVKQGLTAALWAFPLAAFGYFVMRRRVANMAGAGILVGGTVLLFLYHPGGTALRFFIALGLVLLTTNVLLEVLESIHGRLLEQSVTDPLTGAFNRRHMETCLRHVLERNARTGATATLLAIDVDRFGKVNDRFGVEGGDRVLRAFAELIRARLRPHDLTFRAGGQQFMVLLPDTATEEAVTVAEELRWTVEKAALAENHPITISVGAAELSPDDRPEAWIKRALQTLRNAKDEGRNRVMAAAPPAPIGAVQPA